MTDYQQKTAQDDDFKAINHDKEANALNKSTEENDNFSREISEPVKESFSARCYPLLALLSGISFAFHNVFLYQTSAYDSVTVLLPYWIGQMPILVVFMLIKARREQLQTGKCWSKETSKYYKQDGTLNWDIILGGLVLRTTLQIASIVLFYYTLATCQKSNVNLAVMVSITAIAAVFTAIAFQLIFNEKMRPKHWVGMFFLLCGILLISQSQNEDPQDLSSTLTVWAPIAFALLGAVNHTAISVNGRVLMQKGISSSDMTTDAFFVQGLILMLINLIYVLCGNQLPTNILILAACGSVFQMIGYFLCTEASTYGKAGPSQALMEMQSVWQLLMEIILFGRIPNNLEFGGMACALIGTFSIVVGK